MIDFTNFPDIAAPKTLADVPFENNHDAQLMQSITSGTFGFPGGGTNGILLYGKYGAGKSTTAMLIPDALEATSIGMDSCSRNMFRIMSNNNGVGLLNQIDNMCSLVNLGGDKYQYFILDEVDNLSAAAMPQLKSIMDSHMDRAVFIMTTNHHSKVDLAAVSRSHIFGFNKVPPDAWLPSMQRVLAAYGITNMSNSQLLSAATSINGSGRQFATCVKQLIKGYYERFPHLVPPHLQLVNHNTAPIAAAQPLPALSAMQPLLQVDAVSSAAQSSSLPTP
jgi:DNA polymerase III delta prime subunit